MGPPPFAESDNFLHGLKVVCLKENGMQKAAEIEKSHSDGDSDNKDKQGPGGVQYTSFKKTLHSFLVATQVTNIYIYMYR